METRSSENASPATYLVAELGRQGMIRMLDGPRLPPPPAARPKNLVVFLHGYGADGNDLIGIGREWARALPPRLSSRRTRRSFAPARRWGGNGSR